MEMTDQMGGEQQAPAGGGGADAEAGSDLDSAFAAAISPSDYNKGNI